MIRILLVAVLCAGIGMANAAGSKKSGRTLSAVDPTPKTTTSHDTTITLQAPSSDTPDEAVASTPDSAPVASLLTVPAVKDDGSRDTILILTPRSEDDADDEDREDAAENAAEHDGHDNARRHGGAGGITAELFRLDCSPFAKIASTEADLKNKRFDFSNVTFATFGVMGYGGPINGVRLGVAINGGYKALYSDPYETVTYDTSVIRANNGDTILDSMAVMHVAIAYAGLIAEKQFEIDRVALYLGGMLGGGLVVVVKDFIPDNSFSAFTKHENMPEDTTVSDDWADRTAVAPVWAFDVHGGMSYSVARWLHLGIEGKLMWLYSSSGFGYGSGSLRTMNPGGRIRIMFGNAG